MRLCFAMIVALGFGLSGSSALAGDPHLFTVDTGGFSGETGDAFSASVVFETVAVAQGWSFGVCQDESLIAIDGAVEGATTLTVKNGAAPDFSQINVTSAGASMGVVISFLGLATLPVGGPYDILDLDYTITGAVSEATASDICFCDTLGSPPVATVIVVSGASIVPAQVCGSVSIAPPPEFFIDMVCTPDVADVTVNWTTQDMPPFDYLTVHKDGVLVEFIDNPLGETSFSYFDDVDILPGATYTYQIIGVVFLDPMGEATVIQAQCTVTIVSLEVDEIVDGSGFFYGGDTVEIVGIGFLNGTDLMVDFGGNPGTDIMIIDNEHLTVVSPAADALGFVDVTVSNSIGTFTVPNGFLYGFIRGDFDCNSTVDLGDAQGLLLYLFVQGDPPCCFDGSDANDDGTLDAADPISILAHLFDGGAPLPEPFPDVLGEMLDPADVGLDPTDDALICF
ncbi:MAG: IPT/TIG domain-containing protein [Planctomycetes bacterium]|nr:IPT/TIG domain-containing protein [Planctomycetota bacterium]